MERKYIGCRFLDGTPRLRESSHISAPRATRAKSKTSDFEGCAIPQREGCAAAVMTPTGPLTEFVRKAAHRAARVVGFSAGRPSPRRVFQVPLVEHDYGAVGDVGRGTRDRPANA
jgi:hypothetical protein